jgi:hypothetical protein
MKIEVSIGEIADKYTILVIKSMMIASPEKLVNITKEYNHLKERMVELNLLEDSDVAELLEINKELWDVENVLRMYEKENYFGQDFIDAARSVYKLNDSRALTKKKINFRYNSEFVEEKSY